jgi:hypothetical protein
VNRKLLKAAPAVLLCAAVSALAGLSWSWLEAKDAKPLAGSGVSARFGYSGIEAVLDIVKSPSRLLYPGQEGEAVVRISCLGDAPAVFRIGGAPGAEAPGALAASEGDDAVFSNSFGFIASIYGEDADRALYEDKPGGVYYFGYVEPGSPKPIRVRYKAKAAGGAELVKKAERLPVEIESCQAVPQAVADHFLLAAALEPAAEGGEDNEFWRAVKHPPTVTPAPRAGARQRATNIFDGSAPSPTPVMGARQHATNIFDGSAPRMGARQHATNVFDRSGETPG